MVRGSDGRFDDLVHAGGAAVGHPRLAPDLDRERHVHERVAEPEQVRGVVGQRIELVLVEVLASPPRAGGTRRRRTPAARPWCSRAAWRNAPARTRGTSRRTARGRRTPQEGSPSLRLLVRTAADRRGPELLVVVDVLVRSWCSWRSRISWSPSGNCVTARDSSIVCVASSVLPSWSEYSLNVTAASSCWSRSRACGGGTKYSVPSKMWRVVRRRPVVVREVPVRLPDQHHEVREEQERVDAPLRCARRVHRRRQVDVDRRAPTARTARCAARARSASPC